ncbi:hypothetical protein C3L33_17457, partial [Rhododendron williamsianum]
MEGVIMSDSRRGIFVRVIGIFVVMALLVYTSKGLNSDGLYLLKFKENIHDEFNYLGNWNPRDKTPCGWKGVNCTAGSVVDSLDLMEVSPMRLGIVKIGKSLLNKTNEIGKLSSLFQFLAYSNNITGSLPRSLGNLTKLQIFRAGQKYFGSIPSEIGGCESLTLLGLAQNDLGGNIPKELGMLGSLTDLILWNNQLSGFIPKELGNCTNLGTLALYQNNLVGEIPAEIGNIKFLKDLYLYQNELNGTIPREIGNLSLAAEIDFSENSLMGNIPIELSQIKGLRLLYLFQNQLTGFIPNGLSSLRNLTKLDLSINYLTGPIPSGFQNLTAMLQLQLFENSLSGSIPQGLGLQSQLWVVDFSDNNLTGTIPPHICRHTNLMLLNLEANMLLTGSFPSALCNLANLSAVELGQNKFSGPIPPGIGTCQKLQRLDLSDNYFTSTLPREIGNLSELVTFNISSNFFIGAIPSEILNCKMLQRLDLSGNFFENAVPNELGTLSQLELLMLSENKLSGNIPPALGSLSRLTELQMGGNLFSGEIPSELGSLTGLQIALNLSYNNLSGTIPPQLGNLILLEFLFLNNNNLSGDIPSTFDNLSSLLGCNFSYNDLSGPLPTVALFQNMAMSSFIGNKGLCGGPFGNCNGNSSFNSIPPSKGLGAPRGEIIPIVAVAVGGVSLILITVILYHMRRPVEVVASSQEEISSPVSDIYFPPKEGFTFQDLVEATNNFHASYVVGRGAVGTVYKAVMHSGQTIAVKKLASNREGNNIEKSFQAEISTLGKIRHRNIVKLHGFCYHQGSNLLLYEYMERGSLGELLHGTSCLEYKPCSVIEYAYTMKVTEKCDIYSYGVVLLELLTGRTPVQPLDQGVVLMLVESDERYGNFISSPVFDSPKADAS